MQSQLLFAGINGHVIALDRATGAEVWRTKLKGDFVNVVLEDGALYATAKGEMYCLDPATGTVRWNNALSGLGWGLITIAGSGGSQSLVVTQKKRLDEQAAAAGSAGAAGAYPPSPR
jgi:outer membrane protein assembly factor BamB